MTRLISARFLPGTAGATLMALALVFGTQALGSPAANAAVTIPIPVPATGALAAPSSPAAALSDIVAQLATPAATAPPSLVLPPNVSLAPIITPSTSTSITAATVPVTTTWKVVVFLYSRVSAHWVDAHGHSHLISSSLTKAEASKYRAEVAALPALIYSWSGHNVTMKITIISPPHTITKLDTGCGGPYVAPWDIQTDINTYAPAGRYDSIIVGWSANQSGKTLVPYWGCSLDGLYTQAHGATYSTVRVPEASWWWSNQAYGPEPFVHEWLLGVTGFFRTRGYAMPSIEDGVTHYGFKAAANGSWSAWYSAVMRGTLNSKLGPRGITRALWQKTRPTKLH